MVFTKEKLAVTTSCVCKSNSNPRNYIPKWMRGQTTETASSLWRNRGSTMVNSNGRLQIRRHRHERAVLSPGRLDRAAEIHSLGKLQRTRARVRIQGNFNSGCCKAGRLACSLTLEWPSPITSIGLCEPHRYYGSYRRRGWQSIYNFDSQHIEDKLHNFEKRTNSLCDPCSPVILS